MLLAALAAVLVLLDGTAAAEFGDKPPKSVRVAFLTDCTIYSNWQVSTDACASAARCVRVRLGLSCPASNVELPDTLMTLLAASCADLPLHPCFSLRAP